MSEFFIDAQRQRAKEWRAKRLNEMRLEYTEHVIADERARANKDWQSALRHQDKARDVTRRVFNQYPSYVVGELLTEWRDDALRQARQEVQS